MARLAPLPNKYPFRWADPRDLFASRAIRRTRTTPCCSLASHSAFSTGAPKSGPTTPDITSTLAPLFADPYTMLSVRRALPLPRRDHGARPAVSALLASGRLAFVPDTVTCEPGGRIPAPVHASAWNAEAQYAEARFTLDTAEDWRIAATKIKQRLEFSPLREILTFVHDISSPAAGATGFPKPEVRPGPALAPVAEVLDLLRKLVPGVDERGAEEQGLPGPLHVTHRSPEPATDWPP